MPLRERLVHITPTKEVMAPLHHLLQADLVVAAAEPILLAPPEDIPQRHTLMEETAALEYPIPFLELALFMQAVVAAVCIFILAISQVVELVGLVLVAMVQLLETAVTLVPQTEEAAEVVPVNQQVPIRQEQAALEAPALSS